MRVILAKNQLEPFHQRTRHLDTGRAAAHHYDVEQTLPDALRMAVGFFELTDDVAAQGDRVFECLEGEGVFGSAFDAEVVRRGAGRQHQIVEVDAVAVFQ